MKKKTEWSFRKFVFDRRNGAYDVELKEEIGSEGGCLSLLRKKFVDKRRG